jgi:hypothetical protein
MPELSRKDLFLNVPWRIVVVVIETNLAPSYIARMCHGFETVVAISRVSPENENVRRKNTYMSSSISLV